MFMPRTQTPRRGKRCGRGGGGLGAVVGVVERTT